METLNGRKYTMNYHIIKHCDSLDGTGLGISLYVSGCDRHCPHCHNPETHDPNSGKPFTDKEKEEIFEDLNQDWCHRLSLLGGDPLYPGNRESILTLVKEVKDRFPNKKIWLYTGFTYSQIKGDPTIKPILQYCDVLVDGPFIESQKDYTIHYRGSKNQSIIDLHTGDILKVD